uniref:Uncharacterized protein LOC111121412 isoform X2 n=1 Tax=Crassostrea virginica TaxID=6565 RepID=A0A8B8CVB5_CRAVI|nr:uncharacterized protein LOC111121412 isoform X2 [Crassostrea virginica]
MFSFNTSAMRIRMDSCSFGAVIFVCILTSVLSEDQCNLIFNMDPLYIFFGEHTNLSCTLVNSTTSVTSLENSIFLEKWNHQNISEVRYVSTNGTFTAYGHDVVSENLVSKGIGFLPYSCSSPLCEGKISRRFLNVERRPVRVNNGSCLVYNWQNMTCVWDLEVIYLHANTRDINITVNLNHSDSLNFNHLDYDVTLHWSVYTYLSPCKHMRIEGKCLTCEVKEKDDRDSYKRGTYMFVVNITNSRRPEASVSSHFYFNTDELVEPAAVEEIKTIVNKTEIALSWTHSKPYMSLRFQIEYKSQWENSWRMKMTKKMDLTLTDLTPFTRYDIRLTCIPIDIISEEIKGFWSKPTETKAMTLEDVPSAVPVILPSFFSCAAKDCQEIEIYWKPISEEDTRCARMSYQIEVVSPVSPHNRPVNATAASVSAKLPLAANDTNNITVIPFNGKTDEFPDLSPAMLVIPPKSQWPSAPLHLETLSEGQSSRNVTLTWKYPDRLRSKPFNGDFTVFWCRKKSNQVCQGDLNWLNTVVNTSQRLVVSEGTTVDDYMYGIAANGYYGGVSSSSGITWAECVHFTNKTISEKLDVHLVLDELDQGAIKIIWVQYSCAGFRGHVTGYHIKYCLVQNCEDTTVLLNISKDEGNHTLRNLTPAKYKVWVSAISDAGAGPSRELYFVIYGKQIFTGGNESEDAATKALTIVFIVLAILILIVVVVYCLWRHCRHLEEQDIILPKIGEKREKYYSINSQTTSGNESGVPSTIEPSPVLASTYMDSKSSDDSGCVHFDNSPPDVTSGMETDYQNFQIMSSRPPEHVTEQYYDGNELQLKELNREMGCDGIDSSDKCHLLDSKLDPVSEEIEYKSDLSTRNRNSQRVSVCEEHQALVTEDDGSSGEIELYSIEDISCILDDQGSGEENSTESNVCSGSLPEYLPVPQVTSVLNSKNPPVIGYDGLLEGGYVPNDVSVET